MTKEVKNTIDSYASLDYRGHLPHSIFVECECGKENEVRIWYEPNFFVD